MFAARKVQTARSNTSAGASNVLNPIRGATAAQVAVCKRRTCDRCFSNCGPCELEHAARVEGSLHVLRASNASRNYILRITAPLNHFMTDARCDMLSRFIAQNKEEERYFTKEVSRWWHWETRRLAFFLLVHFLCVSTFVCGVIAPYIGGYDSVCVCLWWERETEREREREKARTAGDQSSWKRLH